VRPGNEQIGTYLCRLNQAAALATEFINDPVAFDSELAWLASAEARSSFHLGVPSADKSPCIDKPCAAGFSPRRDTNSRTATPSADPVTAPAVSQQANPRLPARLSV
jgi:hypothetical protein